MQRTRSCHFEPLPLATDKALTGLIGKIHEQGGVEAAICHGSAALANVRRAGGNYLLTGRAVTGFSKKVEQGIPIPRGLPLCQELSNMKALSGAKRVAVGKLLTKFVLNADLQRAGAGVG